MKKTILVAVALAVLTTIGVAVISDSTISLLTSYLVLEIASYVIIDITAAREGVDSFLFWLLYTCVSGVLLFFTFLVIL